MNRVSLAILKKEIREVARDKRTLFLALFLPLLFYPAMIGVSLSVSKREVAERKSQAMTFAYSGVSSELLQEGEVSWRQLDASVIEAADERQYLDGCNAAVISEAGQMRLYYAGTLDGEYARDQLLRLVKAYKKRLVHVNLQKIGVDQGVLEPFQIETVNVTPVRESAGSKFGGAGAYFIIFLAFTGCLSVAVDAGSGERERGTMEAIMTTPASMFSIAVGKFVFVVIMGVLSVISTVVGLSVLLLCLVEDKGMLSWSGDVDFVVMISLMMFAIVVVFAALLYGVSLLAKSSREAHLRASLIMMIVALLLIVSGTDIVAGSDWVWFVPVMNGSAVIKSVIAGTLAWGDFAISFFSCMLFAFMMLLAVCVIFKNKPEKAYLSE